MLKQLIIAGTIAASAAVAMADGDVSQRQFETLRIASGNGAALTVVIPVGPNEVTAPYALTGETTAPEHLQQVTFGQGAPLWIAE